MRRTEAYQPSLPTATGNTSADTNTRSLNRRVNKITITGTCCSAFTRQGKYGIIMCMMVHVATMAVPITPDISHRFPFMVQNTQKKINYQFP